MMKSNLHTHTTFSDGENTIRENVNRAISKGFVSIGISDHSFTEFDSTYCMRKDAENDYLNEISALKEELRDRIEVCAGLELDGYSEITSRDKYDYVIGSCHYVKLDGSCYSVDHCIEGHCKILEDFFDLDPNRFAKVYFDTIAERTLVQKPDILGHFDLVAKFGFMKEDDPKYQKMAEESLAACLEVTKIVEVNTGAVSRGIRSIPYPAPYLLPKIKELGGRVLLSSDSHKMGNLDFAFDDTLKLLKSFGFGSIVILKNGEFCDVAI